VGALWPVRPYAGFSPFCLGIVLLKFEQVRTLDGDDRKNGAEDAQDQTCRPGVTMLELMSSVCVLDV
jgi:hypothetical protein